MDEFSFAQKQRLAYIDFKLYFTGMVTRSEIVSHFELGLAAATRDLKFYKDNAPDNMAYDNVEKNTSSPRNSNQYLNMMLAARLLS